MKYNDQQKGFIVRNWDRIPHAEMLRIMGTSSHALRPIYLAERHNSHPHTAHEVLAEYLILSLNYGVVEAYAHAHEMCSKLQDHGFETLTLMDNPETGPVHEL